MEPQGIQRRSFAVESAALDADGRTVELSFSSEAPYERSWGVEILDHSAGAVNLDRLNGGGALLVDHDVTDQVGVVELARVGDDRKGRASVRFGRSQRASEIFNDVKEGIRRLVSVGYICGEVKKEEGNGEGGLETYRVTRWTPFEISLVSVPADASVGVGRSLETTPQPIPAEESTHIMSTEINIEAIKADVTKGEQARAKELVAIGSKFRKLDEAHKAIAEGTSVEAFRAAVLDGIAAAPAVVAEAKRTETRSIGEMLVTSDDYRALAKRAGSPNRSAGFTFDRVSFRSIASLAGVAGVPHVTDLFAQGETALSTLRYMQEGAFVNGAGAVAAGGLKPSGDLALTEVDAAVRKIAVVAKVTDEVFADYATVQSVINERLPFMVAQSEEAQVLNGNGTTPNILGVLNAAGVLTSGGASNAADSIYDGLIDVQTKSLLQPDAIVVNPADWQVLRLAKDTAGSYLGGSPFLAGAITLWGLPVIVSPMIAPGTALVGAFKQGGQVFRRLGVTVETSNSNEDDFKRNLIAIRAESRLALAIYRPSAFSKVTL